MVILSWDTNATDIDLHVTEPGGEECSFQNKSTSCGGTLDHDVTTGFGPETYALRRAKPGAYRIGVHYYSGGSRTVATVKIITHCNGENEHVETKTVELPKVASRETVTTIVIPLADAQR